MPKVSQSHLDARRAQILEAAIICFSKQGFHRTTMQDIVRQSKLSPGAIYNYFASKEDIIEAIAFDRHSRERELFMNARKGNSVKEVLHQIRDSFFGQLKDPNEQRRRRVTIQLWAEARRNPRIRAVIRRGMEGPRLLLRDILREGQRRGEIASEFDADSVARSLIAMFHGLVLQVEWGEHVQVERFTQLLEQFLMGVPPNR